MLDVKGATADQQPIGNPVTTSNPPTSEDISPAGNDEGSGTKSGSSPLTSVAPVVDEEEVTPIAADNSGADTQNIVRDSMKFTPESTSNSPSCSGRLTGVSTTACPVGNRL